MEGLCRKGTWAKAERSGGTSQKSTRRRYGDGDRTDGEVTIRDPNRGEGGEVNERLGRAKGEIKGRSVQASGLGDGALTRRGWAWRTRGPVSVQARDPHGVKTPSLARRFVANAAGGMDAFAASAERPPLLAGAGGHRIASHRKEKAKQRSAAHIPRGPRCVSPRLRRRVRSAAENSSGRWPLTMARRRQTRGRPHTQPGRPALRRPLA
jgi:hypothetical protein